LEKTHTLGLSLLDFVPNLAFLLGGIYLIRWVKNSGSKFSFPLMKMGSVLVLIGGFSKAIWKLLYTIRLADIWVLSELQFMVLTPGFTLMFISAISMAKQEKQFKNYSAMAVWKIPLLAVMTISSIGLQATLGYIAFKKKIRTAELAYGISILCVLGLAGMASAEQSIMNQWIEEIINSIGQIAFAGGSYLIFDNMKKSMIAKTS